MGVLVALRHLGAPEEEGVVEHRAAALLLRGELAHQVGELLRHPRVARAELAGLAERVLDLVRSDPVHVGGRELGVTVSIGGAFSRGDATVTPERILAAADRSMYEAKTAGRDRAGNLIDASEA